MARRNRSRSRRRRPLVPGWLGVLIGLTAGLGVAGWIWLRAPLSPPAVPSAAKAPPPPSPAVTPPAAPAAPTRETPRYTFYETLPNQEVIVPEQDDGGRRGVPVAPVEAPGIYVIQAGAFPDFAQADALKARLALLGVVAQIQNATVDGRSFNRVRIGPLESLDELNRIRRLMRDNGIDFQLIRVSQ